MAQHRPAPRLLPSLLLAMGFVAILRAQPSSAAITVDNSAGTFTSSNATTLTLSNFAVGSGSNRILLVGVAIKEVGQFTTSSVKFNGTSMTLVGSKFSGATEQMEMYYLLNPVSTTASVVLSGTGSGSQLALGAVSLAGVLQSAPAGFTSANGRSLTPSVTINGVGGSDMVVDACAFADQTANPTAGASQTSRWVARSALITSMASTRPASGSSSVTMSWTGNVSSDWAIGAVRLQPGALSIAGTIFEDVAGDAVTGGQAIGDAANPGAVSVTVKLYLDSGDNLPGAGDGLVATTATLAGGAYTFTGLAAGTYWVAADSKTVPSSAGLRAGFSQADVWAEQTYGSAGSRRSDGAGGTVTRGSAGACYGGQRGAQSDDAGTLATSEHVTGVTVAGSPATGVDFGFSFNVVTTLRAGDAADDDVANNRTVQGTLRQFVRNANAIAGANALRFVPAVATNASGGGGTWWSLGVTVALPAITDGSTTIDGAAYDLADGTTVRDTNAGQLGAGGTVGVSALPLSQVDRPELEVQDLRAITVVPNAFDVQAANVTIRNLAVFGFGGGMWNSGFTNIALRDSATNALIERNLIGTGAAAFTDPGASARTDGAGVLIDGTSTGTIRNNLIGYCTAQGIWIYRSSGGWTVTNNEVRGNDLGSMKFAGGIGVDAGNAHQVTQNLFVGNQSAGIQLNNAPGNHVVRNNTITGNGVGDPPNQTAGVRVDTTAAELIELNVITTNHGAGVLLAKSSSGVTISRNAISQNGTILNVNSVGPSGQIGIDLLSPTDGQARGTAPFVSPNDGVKNGTLANNSMDFPVLSASYLNNGSLYVAGYVGSAPSQATFAGARVELFKSDNDPAGYGEGSSYLGLLTADGSGNFTGTLAVTGLAIGDKITATATDGSGNTSEFGPDSTVRVLSIVKRAFDVNGSALASGSVLAKGTIVQFLLYVDDRGGEVTDLRLSDVLDPAFVYVPGSLRSAGVTTSCATTTCSGAEESAILAAALAGAGLTDAVDGDTGALSGTTIQVGKANAGSAQLNIAAGKVYAIVFRARMQ